MMNDRRQPLPAVPLQPFAVIGMSGSGKTKLCQRLNDVKKEGSGDQFSEEYIPTLGVDFTIVETLGSDKKPIKYQMWDFSGAERFQGSVEIELSRAYGARPIVMILDPTQNLVQQIEYYEQMKKAAPQETQFIFVVTKADLFEGSEKCNFTIEQVTERLPGETVVPFSAKTGHPSNATLFKHIDEAAKKTNEVINKAATEPYKPPKDVIKQVHDRVLDKLSIELIRIINKYAKPGDKLSAKFLNYSDDKFTEYNNHINRITDSSVKDRAEKLRTIIEKGEQLLKDEHKSSNDFKNALKQLIIAEQKSFDKYANKDKPWYKSAKGDTYKASEEALKEVKKLKL